jgi:TetR/AcrR family transcriptional regulator, regulator of cefoperazone and chloramphenicol sensitivity
MMTPNGPARRDTRTAIIEAAMRGFGEKGYAATGTREIAALAKTNVASIAYHFGGKDGLRTACASYIVELMAGVIQPDTLEAPPPADRAAARAVLTALVERMVRFLLLEPRAGLVAGFIVREMAQPSEALDVIYEGLFEGVHRRACVLWAAATGRKAESTAVRLAVFATIGQVLYFHLGRPIVSRRLGWERIGPAEARAIAETVTCTLLARLDADAEAAR